MRHSMIHFSLEVQTVGVVRWLKQRDQFVCTQILLEWCTAYVSMDLEDILLRDRKLSNVVNDCKYPENDIDNTGGEESFVRQMD